MKSYLSPEGKVRVCEGRPGLAEGCCSQMADGLTDTVVCNGVPHCKMTRIERRKQSVGAARHLQCGRQTGEATDVTPGCW